MSAIGIAITDGHRRLLDCNQALAAMLGYDDPGELIGRNASELAYPAETPERAAAIDRLRHGEFRRDGLELQYRRTDGTAIWVKLTTSAIPGLETYFTFFEDITERKRVERERDDAERELRARTQMLEQAELVGGVGASVWYANEPRVSWSPQAARIFGFSDEEVASEDPVYFREAIHPEDRDRILPELRAAFAAGVPVESECRIIRRNDGALRWIHARGGVEPGPDGEPARMFCAVTDITERREEEREAQAKAAILERAQEVAGIGTFIVDLERRTVWLSGEIAGILGAGAVPFEMPIEEYRDRFYHPDERMRVAAVAEASYERGDSLSLESRFVRADGEVIWLRTKASTQRDGDGRPIVLGVYLDVTEQKRAELQASEAAAELMLAQELGQVGSWVWYPHENRTTRSPAASRILGMPRDQWDSSDTDLFNRVVHPDDLEKLTRDELEAFEAARSTEGEYRIIRDGEIRWVYSQADVERDEHGEPYRMVGMLLDITDRRRAEQDRRELEERLLQSQKLDALGQLAGGIAHDFNNLLTVIGGTAQLGLEKAAEPGVRDDLLQISRAAELAAELTRQLLVFSRRQAPETRQLDLNEVVARLPPAARAADRVEHRHRGRPLRPTPACTRRSRTARTGAAQPRPERP